MIIKEIQSKSILQKTGIPMAGYAINPYIGCSHRCVYCYARFMKRYTSHKEAWGYFLDAKVNAPEVLKKQLEKRRRPIEDTVFLSSVTDPYLSLEKEYRLTRRILKILLDYNVPISILTKSDLVIRDIDLFSQFERCKIGLSLMTTDDDFAIKLEPRALLPSGRIRILHELKKKGIRTYAFISPYLPLFSSISKLLKRLDGAIDEIGIEALNRKGLNGDNFDGILAKYSPNRFIGSKSLLRSDLYWKQLEFQTRILSDEYNIFFFGLYNH